MVYEVFWKSARYPDEWSECDESPITTAGHRDLDYWARHFLGPNGKIFGDFNHEANRIKFVPVEEEGIVYKPNPSSVIRVGVDE